MRSNLEKQAYIKLITDDLEYAFISFKKEIFQVPLLEKIPYTRLDKLCTYKKVLISSDQKHIFFIEEKLSFIKMVNIKAKTIVKSFGRANCAIYEYH